MNSTLVAGSVHLARWDPIPDGALAVHTAQSPAGDRARLNAAIKARKERARGRRRRQTQLLVFNKTSKSSKISKETTAHPPSAGIVTRHIADLRHLITVDRTGR